MTAGTYHTGLVLAVESPRQDIAQTELPHTAYVLLRPRKARG